MPFGLTEPDEIVRKRDRQLKKGIHYHQCPIESVDIEANSVALENGTTLDYDVLLVATGTGLLPEETEGTDRAGLARDGPHLLRHGGGDRRSPRRSTTSRQVIW